MKDLFSEQAGLYAKHRPGYPEALMQYVLSFAGTRTRAWDCATGNGQAARLLAPHFEKVFATDISENQIREAPPVSNIEYTISPAEKTRFPDNFFDLVTVAQAYHWLRFDDFSAEVHRVCKPGSIIAVWGYGIVVTGDPGTDQAIAGFYSEVVGRYWDPERKWVEAAYRGIPFPYEELEPASFHFPVSWSRDDLKGYLNTWSSVQHYIRALHHNPVDDFMKSMDSHWAPGIQRSCAFPIFLRLGKVIK